MSLADTSSDIKFLRHYQISTSTSCCNDEGIQNNLLTKVTIISYFFRPHDQVPEEFPYLTQALLRTWRHCGMLKTVIVTDVSSEILNDFALQHPNVLIQTEPALVPGDVDSMSRDCNSKLFQRFETEYALIVQDDGFPIRAGLDAFVGKYDYIGSPWRRADFRGLCAGYLSGIWPANGGFSLRSKKFCSLVSDYWDRYYSNLPFDKAQFQEDIFCTITLPREHPSFRHQIRWANSKVAAEFSYDASVPKNINRHPFGFHGAKAFGELFRAGQVPSTTPRATTTSNGC